jgi:hypothetical protein
MEISYVHTPVHDGVVKDVRIFNDAFGETEIALPY